MTTTYDTLVTGGVEKRLADWGFILSSCIGERRSQAPDTFRGTAVGQNLSASPTFAFEQAVSVFSGRVSADGSPNSFSGGVCKFVGKRVLNPLKGDSGGPGFTYEFQNGRYDLDNIQYRQGYAGITGTSQPNEVILFTRAPYGGATTNITAGEQISDIVNYAIGLGLDAQPGTIDANLSIYFPSYIVKPMTCSAAIDKCLEMFPRVSEVWDYSFTPPKVSFIQVDNLPSVTAPLFDGASHKGINITRRDDLVARAVVVVYRINGSVDGQTVTDYAIDQWGPVMETAYQTAGGGSAGNTAAQNHSAKKVYDVAFIAAFTGTNYAAADAAGLAAVTAAVLAGTCDPREGIRVPGEMIDLQGTKVTTATGYLDVEPVVCNDGVFADAKNWWSSQRGGEVAELLDLRARFQDPTGAATTIASATLSAGTLAAYPNRIVRGTYHPWMVLSDNTPVVAIKSTLSAGMQYAVYDVVGTSETDVSTGNLVEASNVKVHHVDLELTNGVSGTYTTIASVTPGETYIIGVDPVLGNGIARNLWLDLQTAQYDGSYVKVEYDFTNNITTGNRLNLSGGNSAWLTMAAQISSVREDYGTHTTSVAMGISKHLTAGQMSSLLNMWRMRVPWFNPAIRTDNTQTSSAGNVEMPVTSGNSNTVLGVRNDSRKKMIDYSSGVGSSINGSIDIDAFAAS